MSVATKLEYLNNTKQLLKENINNLGGNLTTEPFRQYASVLEGIYESLPKVSGIGASLSLSPSMVGKIKLNEIQGDTLQENTPTPDSPVPIQSVTGLQNVGVCGKNLINGLLDNSTTGKKLERTINADENFYLYIKTNNTTSDRCYAFLDNTNVGTIWVNNNNGTLTFSGSRNFTFNRIRIQDNTTVSENMLTLGSSATTYEPYQGNTYEVNLGKNLLDLDYTSQTINGVTFTINEDKSITLNGTSTSGFSLYDTQPIKLKAGTYTHSSNQIKRGIFLSLNNISATMLNRNNNVTKTTFTISQDTTYPKYLIYIDNNITFDNYNLKLQLEKGSQATSYSPYFTPIELNKIGTYEDRIYKNNGKWYVEKNIGKTILDGTESWETQWNGDNIHGWRTTIPNLKQTTSSSQSSYVISNNYETRTQDENFSTGNYGISNRVNQSQIIIKNNDITSPNDFTTWLGTHNTTVLYQLATPTYTEITNTELIEDLESLNNAKSEDGTTNINVTSEDLSMILNVSVLKGE